MKEVMVYKIYLNTKVVKYCPDLFEKVKKNNRPQIFDLT